MRVVPLEELGGLIEAWARRWAVFSPSREAGVVAFRPWRGEPFWQWYRNATLPPKELFLPRQEELFRFEGLREALPEQEFLVCGIRPCDARALELLDRVFEAEPADPHWTGRRRRALLVGFACTEPCEASFCVDLGVDPLEAPGVDLMVLPWEGRAYLWANTDRGHGLLEGAPQEGELPAGLAEQVRSRFPRGLPLEGARRGMEAALAEEGRWRELAFGCVTCGVCTLLCPTCHSNRCTPYQVAVRRGKLSGVSTPRVASRIRRQR